MFDDFGFPLGVQSSTYSKFANSEFERHLNETAESIKGQTSKAAAFIAEMHPTCSMRAVLEAMAKISARQKKSSVDSGSDSLASE